MNGNNALSTFDPLIAEWFSKAVGEPTEVQIKAWPLIARGAHVLVSAPTGTGKTLAAFLWGIDRLVRGTWAAGKVRILYVSPLKALNNDIQKNLIAPLEGLGQAFREAGRELPPIRVLTRSGDTPYGERRRMLRRPPEILITTPESLNLILSSPNARLMLDGVATVILDEIHAVASTKRGTHLITAVERLVRLSGEFQRIALSATVRPLSLVADFIGGFRVEKNGGPALYRKRPVEIVHCPLAKRYEIAVSFTGAALVEAGGTSTGRDTMSGGVIGAGAAAAAGGMPAGGSVERRESAGRALTREPAFGLTPDSGFPLGSGGAFETAFWSSLAAECRRIIRENRSSLFFVNSRRHAEKICRLINEGEREQLAWSHHGSLSKELRLVVEQRLKSGELKAIVATSSLELGIDIGVLDRVVLIQTPFSVNSAVQRIGRAGHRIGIPSSAVIFPLFGKDIADAAVMARSVLRQDIESVAPMLCPLDVLAQLIVSMTAVETWNRDELFDAVRGAFPFNSLSREHFDLVLAMLNGRYAESRLRELSPLVSMDAMEGTVKAREGALQRLYTSGGTIPDRGYFSLRAADSHALIGELDEEFVWERSVGDSFFFGTQGWRINKIDHQNVEVVPVRTSAAMAPFWKAEEWNRDFHLSERIAVAFEDWNGRLREPDLLGELEREYRLDSATAAELIRFLSLQKGATRSDLPHKHHLLVEHTRDPSGGRRPGRDAESPKGMIRVILHTLWGGRVNRPYSLALAAAWEEKFGCRPEMLQDNDAILLLLPEDVPASEIVSLVNPENLDRLLRKKLEGSGFFGARFRENASRALLLPKPASKRRMPLWFTRLRAKNLYAAVSKYADFPILLETWRSCLRDEFDMESLYRLLNELSSGAIRVTDVSTPAPSPLCGNMMWKQTNTYMYEDDTPRGGGGTALRGDLIKELALSSALRPRIKPETAAEFQEKVQRTARGYAPRGAEELLDWVKERLLIPSDEWARLLDACRRDHETPETGILSIIGPKTMPVNDGIAARESAPRISRAVEQGDDETLTEVLSEWLRYYGPVEPEFVRRTFAVKEDRFQTVLQDLVEEELIVIDRLVDGSDAVFLCDRENLEILLRITRARARPVFQPLAAEALPLFVAQHQGLTRGGAAREAGNVAGAAAPGKSWSAGSSDLAAGERDEAAREHGQRSPVHGSEALKEAWDVLFGYRLPARLWEEEILPARLEGYRAAWLENLFAETGLVWFGCGRERLGFGFREDLELFTDPDIDEQMLNGIFPGGAGKFGFWELHDNSGLSSQALSQALWRLVWSGSISNDSFQTVRRGIESRFRAVESGGEGRGRRAGFNRWQSSRPAIGYWFRLPAGGRRDALEEEELNRDRIRQVLRRYGVVYREILESELPPLRWGALFRSLRIMELSGEVLAGRFFDGIPGLQFASPQAFDELRGTLDEDAVFWLNAADPASLCGVDLDAVKGNLPARIPATHLVFHGRKLVVISRRQARELELHVPENDPRIVEYLGFLRILVNRDVRPLTAVHVETINGVSAVASPYKKSLLSFGFTEDYKRLTYRGGI